MKNPLLALLFALPASHGEPGTHFSEQPERCAADLLLDVRLGRDSGLVETAEALAPLGVEALLLVRPGQVEGIPEVAATLDNAGLEAGLWLHWPREPTSGGSPSATWSQLRRDRRGLRRAVGQTPKAVGTARLSPALEGSLEIFGFTLQLPAPDGVQQAPRRSRDPRNIEGSGLVLWPVQPSEADASLGAEGAIAALLDRVAADLADGGPPVVRLSLPARLATRHIPLLDRWNREVLEPCGAAVVGRVEAERALKAWLRTSPADATATTELDGSGPAQTVVPQELELAAASLGCGTEGATLPRTVGQGLALSETWLALSFALSETVPPWELHPVLPPQASPRSVLPSGGVVIDAEELRASVAQLVPTRGAQLPAFARVGEHALTSAELLCAMAGVYLGSDPVRVVRTYSPDPYSPGLGWE